MYWLTVEIYAKQINWRNHIKRFLNSRWQSLRLTGRNTGAYSFQNAFFYLQFADDSKIFATDDTSNAELRAALITQRKTRRYFDGTHCTWRTEKNNLIFYFRRAKLHPQKQRSKYICKPEAVVEAGNHFVWEFITGRGSLNVPADAGILHHYRVSAIVFQSICSVFFLS